MKDPESFTVDELAELAKIAIATDEVAPGGWYPVASPWLPRDAETYIIAGSHDPHIGVPVCDFNDAGLAGVEDKFEDDEWSDRNWQIAKFIETFDPPAVRALIRQCKRLQISADERAKKAASPA